MLAIKCDFVAPSSIILAWISSNNQQLQFHLFCSTVHCSQQFPLNSVFNLARFKASSIIHSKKEKKMISTLRRIVMLSFRKVSYSKYVLLFQNFALSGVAWSACYRSDTEGVCRCAYMPKEHYNSWITYFDILCRIDSHHLITPSLVFIRLL